MFRKTWACALAVAIAASLIGASSASAATLVGNNCKAGRAEAGFSVISLSNPAGYPLPSAIPSAGVITSWTISIQGEVSPELSLQGKLKVFEAAPVPGQFKVVGESELESVGVGVFTNPTRVPVKSGDLLGNALLASIESQSVTGSFFCETGAQGDEIAEVPGDPGLGSTVLTLAQVPGAQNPITVMVEPDADGDGYGDETQDKCPTDASAQGTCPAPPAPPKPAPPIALSASAAAKKGLATVTLTSSAQATVTIGGSVNLGKGKTVKLSGGTQIVAPGTLAKFTVVFPAKLKAALKQLPKSKKLTLKLSASAPGATTTNLTVKVPGQKKVPTHRHR